MHRHREGDPATTNAEKLISHGGIGSLTMTEAGADSLLICFTAMMAHLSMSLGQTLFLHISAIAALAEDFSRITSNFTTSIMQDHVVSTHISITG
jgi:hypothetical protein